ncbi:hypothetical protein M9H77_31360 [Catharanthus roseus]|uniref:Uncharacterized protein n=1 Tax=Catharanthus roseus TaxID=4058 RepID=A0ACC0A442_CATRO|nr:hypothetical protein M9H77_31360 [Catharanthus roseus]
MCDTCREVAEPANELLVCTVFGLCFDRLLSPLNQILHVNHPEAVADAIYKRLMRVTIRAILEEILHMWKIKGIFLLIKDKRKENEFGFNKKIGKRIDDICPTLVHLILSSFLEENILEEQDQEGYDAPLLVQRVTRIGSLVMCQHVMPRAVSSNNVLKWYIGIYIK